MEIDTGAYRIATLGHAAFAVLSMQSSISVFRGETRIAQTTPVPGAIDLAFAEGVLYLLSERGISIVDADHSAVSRPDRPPASGDLRLLPNPSSQSCLLVDANGQSWIIDKAGTYPRGPKLPPASHFLQAADGLRTCFATSVAGIDCWRDGIRVHTWHEAVAAAPSADGRRVAVVFAGAVEIHEVNL
jgi:hypothetical protein